MQAQIVNFVHICFPINVCPWGQGGLIASNLVRSALKFGKSGGRSGTDLLRLKA